jgi:hypothetical protein
MMGVQYGLRLEHDNLDITGRRAGGNKQNLKTLRRSEIIYIHRSYADRITPIRNKAKLYIRFILFFLPLFPCAMPVAPSLNKTE